MILNFILMTLYRWIVAPIALFIFPLLALCGHQKIKAGLKVRWRRDLPNKLDTNVRPIWFHCASGEFEYAKPIIRTQKIAEPNTPIIVTFFSPTYISTIQANTDVDLCLPLPWDLPGPVSHFIKEYQPKALLIARTDLWPEMLEQCRYRKVPTLLFAATQSRPLHFLKAWLLSKLNMIFAVSEADKENLQIKVSSPVQVAGDSRYEQVRYRLENPHPVKSHLFTSSPPLFLAGSTWPEDEKILLSALLEPLKQKVLSAVLVPHEPTQTHIESLQKQIKRLGLSSQRYSQIEQWDPENILIIDVTGILADLYKFCDAAFIGGSFKGSVHSVMEATSLGVPVLVGPYIQNNREALEFNQIPLTENLHAVEICTSEAQLRVALFEIFNNKIKRESWRSQIKILVEKKIGASQKVMQWLAQLNH